LKYKFLALALACLGSIYLVRL